MLMSTNETTNSICNHSPYEILEIEGSRAGLKGEAVHWCGECGAWRYKNVHGSWSAWEIPRRERERVR